MSIRIIRQRQVPCKKPVSLCQLEIFVIFGFKLRIMETLRIEIVNPKAKRLLKDLADLNLITIDKAKDLKVEFKELLSKLRSKSDTALSLDEITKEVEIVRASRYESKAK